MKAFVTGGSGFLGSRLIPQLIEKGYVVRALARSEQSAAKVKALGAEAVMGDILDPSSLHAGIVGSDIVFHLAAWYKTGGSDWMQAESINVNGTRNVLTIAHECGVPKIIYTSTIAIFGDTKGVVVDENYVPPNGPFLTEYNRTKWMAHYRVALPLIAQGAPIIIIMPGLIYGPGDPSLMGQFMRRFYKRQMPALPGPELTLTWAHVDDIAAGHILAAEKGKIGESYLLTGPAIPMGDMVTFWSRLTGIPAPSVKVPAKMLRPLAPIAGMVEKRVELPAMFSQEAIATLSATYIARSDKARNELGWKPRPPHAGMLETFAWLREEEGEISQNAMRRQFALFTLALAVILFVLWIFRQDKASQSDT